jgi:3-oxoacyl-[acyl-carrier protein] reductase
MKTYQGISLAGRTALVTGAGGGTGRGMALALAAAGANVVIAARRAVTGDETAALIVAEGGAALSVEADATSADDIERAVAAAVARFGGLDIMIHNAVNKASTKPVNLWDFDEASWDSQAAVALDGAFHCAKAAYPHLKQAGARGRFILLGSALGLHGGVINPLYAAIKGNYRGFVKALAREWGPDGITVNWIAPASLVESSEAYFERNPTAREALMAQFPLGRMGRPREDIGGAVTAICSEAFGYVTAQTIQVDGGLFTAI